MKKITKYPLIGLVTIILVAILIFNQAIINALNSFWQFLGELNPVYFIIAILLPFVVWTTWYFHKKNKVKIVRRKIENKEVNPAQIKYRLDLKLMLKQDHCKMKYTASEVILNAFQELRRSISPNSIEGSYVTFHQITKEKEGYFSVWYKEHRKLKEGSAIYDWFALINGEGKYKQYGPFMEKSADDMYRAHSIKSFNTMLKNNHLEVFLQTERREDTFRTVPSGISSIRMNINIK